MSQEEEVLGKAYDSRLMKRLLEYLRPYKWQTTVALSAILLRVVLGPDIIGPFLIKVAIDRFLAPVPGAHSFLDGWLSARPLVGIGQLALIYLAALLCSFVLEFVQTYLMQWTGQKVMFDLRSHIFRHLQRLHVGFFDKNPVGRLMTRVTTDVDAVNDLFTSGVVTIFGDLFTLLGIMAVMLRMNASLALVTFSMIPLFFLVTNWFRRGARESFRQVRKCVARINAFLQENLNGMSVVQLFSREDRNLERFREINRQHADANMAGIFYYAVFYPAIEFLPALATALILLYGGGRVLASTLTLGALVAFIQYSERFWRPISDLSEKFNILQAAMASSERIFTLLDTKVEISAPENALS